MRYGLVETTKTVRRGTSDSDKAALDAASSLLPVLLVSSLWLRASRIRHHRRKHRDFLGASCHLSVGTRKISIDHSRKKERKKTERETAATLLRIYVSHNNCSLRN